MSDIENTIENTTDEAPKSLFEKLFTMTEDEEKVARIPLMEKKIKRQLDSAYDDAEGKIIEAQETKNKLMKDFDNFDINAILKQSQIISACELVQSEIQVLHYEYFGTELDH